MIDLHAHVLPGIDDGPRDLEAAIALVRAAAVAGTRQIVATSHVSERYPTSADEIDAAVAGLREALAADGVDVGVIAGAELALDRAPDLDDVELDRLRLGEGPYLMVESPLSAAVGDFDSMIIGLARTHRIVLAHPERCPAFRRNPERLMRLVARGAVCSITAGALGGRFGRDVRRFTIWLFEQGLVHNVASDTHDLGARRPEVLAFLADAERDLPGLREHVPWLTETVPAAVLAGKPIRTPPRLRLRRTFPWRHRRS
jgi:protein-tyrosine phosphatase